MADRAERARKQGATVVPKLTKGGSVLKADLPSIMYGYGDSKKPMEDSVNLMESLVCEYITGLTNLALDRAARTATGTPTLDVFMYAIQDEAKKRRVLHLLAMAEENRKRKNPKKASKPRTARKPAAKRPRTASSSAAAQKRRRKGKGKGKGKGDGSVPSAQL